MKNFHVFNSYLIIIFLFTKIDHAFDKMLSKSSAASLLYVGKGYPYPKGGLQEEPASTNDSLRYFTWESASFQLIISTSEYLTSNNLFPLLEQIKLC